jgi:hypothetical protein
MLLEKVPNDGTSIGNKKLRGFLNWEYEKYFRVRNRLVDAGELLIGQGKGGSVFLAPGSTYYAKKRTRAKSKQIFQPEVKYYEPIKNGLREFWVREQFPSLTDFEIQITAHQGSKSTGGIWTRPDIAVYSYGAYRFFPGRTYDLISFEVKLATSTDIRAVFEAKGHARRASRSYVICVGDLDAQAQQDLTQVAREQSIGLILATDEKDPESWEVLIDAVRRDPDPAWIDEFVRQNFDEAQQLRIEAWCR